MLPSRSFHSIRLFFYRFLLRSFFDRGRVRIPLGPPYLAATQPRERAFRSAPVLCLDFFRFPRTGSTKICLEAGSRTARQSVCCYAKADVNMLSVLKKA